MIFGKEIGAEGAAITGSDDPVIRVRAEIAVIIGQVKNGDVPEIQRGFFGDGFLAVYDFEAFRFDVITRVVEIVGGEGTVGDFVSFVG